MGRTVHVISAHWLTEVEAYGGLLDSASHCRFGHTPRNAPMWEAGGRAYVYFCYGMHHMLNVVTGPAGDGSAILIRSCEPMEGLATIRARRGGLAGPVLLTGPGKVAQALAVDRSFSGHLLYEPGGLELLAGEPVGPILEGPRVGVEFAEARHRLLAWRFAVADSPWVSSRKRLVLSPQVQGGSSDPEPRPPGSARCSELRNTPS